MSDEATVELLGPAERERAAAAWAALEAQGRPALACSWWWTGTWLRHYGDTVPHAFALVEADGVPLAAALVTWSTRRVGRFPALRSLHLGTAGEPAEETVRVERNALLTAPGARGAATLALRRRLDALPGWDELRLDGFVPEDARELLGEVHAEVEQERCPVADLSAMRERGAPVLEALGSGARRRVRQGLRQLGEVEVEWAQDEAQALDVLDELVALHEARWRPGVFSAPRFAAFHRDLVSRSGGREPVWLVRARAGGRVVGCLYGFVEDGAALFYQSGLMASADNRVRPGLVTHALAMQACLDRGLDLYDFLGGESRYKLELATGSRELVSARVPRATVRGRGLRLVRHARRRVRARPARIS